MNPHAAPATPLYPLSQNEMVPGQPQGSSVVDYTTVNVASDTPRDHIVWSLFSFVNSNPCCLGLAALIHSVKARDRKMAGDLEGARHYGRTACILNTIATVLMSVLILILIIVLSVTIRIPEAITSKNSYNSYGNGYRYRY